MGAYSSASLDEEQGEMARAWPRFWARIFDVVIYSLPAAFLLGFAFPSLFTSRVFSGPGGSYLAGMMILPIAMVIDAILISQFGSSPGKAIAGLYVADLDHQRLNLETSLKRNLLVYAKGLVLGLPLLCLAGYASGHAAVKETGHTSWDADTNSRVFAGTNNDVRTVMIALLAIVALGVSNALSKLS